MSTIIHTFTHEGFNSPVFQEADGRVHFMADMDVDVDGSGSSHGDPYYQPDTSLHYQGKPLNADVERYIVVSLAIVDKITGVVLGSQARVTYRGKTVDAVVGDLGPTKTDGEASRAVALALGINPSPINGGVDAPAVFYEFFPGVPAVVDGKTYSLQPHR